RPTLSSERSGASGLSEDTMMQTSRVRSASVGVDACALRVERGLRGLPPPPEWPPRAHKARREPGLRLPNGCHSLTEDLVKRCRHAASYGVSAPKPAPSRSPAGAGKTSRA